MFQYFNNHPRQLLVGDCVKRAIALAANMDYATVQKELNRHKRITHAKSFHSDRNPHSYVESVLHAEKLIFPAEKRELQMTGALFCKEYPCGRYILEMPSHWTACINGVIYDVWDPSEKRVFAAYKIPSRTAAAASKGLEDKVFCSQWIKDGGYYLLTVCHEGGKPQQKRIYFNELSGYRRCLLDLGYRELPHGEL